MFKISPSDARRILGGHFSKFRKKMYLVKTLDIYLFIYLIKITEVNEKEQPP